MKIELSHQSKFEFVQGISLEVVSNLFSEIHNFHSTYPVAIGFPGITKNNFGNHVILYGSEQNLKSLLNTDSLFSLLSDYTPVGLLETIKPVKIKSDTKYFNFKRIRICDKTKPSYIRNVIQHKKHGGEGSLRDKIMKLHNLGLTTEQIQVELFQKPKVPFIKMFSKSTNSTMPLGVSVEKSPTNIVGEFDAYGLSNTATLPV
jgi:CRISPR-associated endoribonuclease Cas6/Csy4 subtype I-F